MDSYKQRNYDALRIANASLRLGLPVMNGSRHSFTREEIDKAWRIAADKVFGVTHE